MPPIRAGYPSLERLKLRGGIEVLLQIPLPSQLQV